jgi:hypothetical protein
MSQSFLKISASAFLLCYPLLHCAPTSALPMEDSRKPTKTVDRAPERRPLSDEDILNPKKLVFNVNVPFLDSFDGSQKGQVFISKRSIVGSPDPEDGGIFGEPGSQLYQSKCLLFCPPLTTDIDATYLYVFETKGECKIGARAIGWTEIQKKREGGFLTGRDVIVGRVQYTARASNINQIAINGKIISMNPKEYAQIQGPYGTNYKYFPRNKSLGLITTTDNSSDLSAGFITDLHYFPAQPLINALKKSPDQVVIEFPNWQPSKQIISGAPLDELKALVSNCEDEDIKPTRPVRKLPQSKKKK